MSCENGVCEINFAENDATPVPTMTFHEAVEVLRHYKFILNTTKPNMPSTLELSAAIEIACACIKYYDEYYHISEQLNESNTRER